MRHEQITGTDTGALPGRGGLPKMSPLNPQYLTRKHKVFEKIAAFVEKFKGIGDRL